MTTNSLEILGACIAGLIIGVGVGEVVARLMRRYIIIRRVAEAPQPHLPPETQEALKAQTLIVSEWQTWNPWYGDPILALEAQSVHLALQRDNPGQPLEQNLIDVTMEMRRRHPEIVTLN